MKGRLFRITAVLLAESDFKTRKRHKFDEKDRQNEEALTEWAFKLDATKGEIPCDDIDLALIPGVAFDHEGHRMGRGRGYYDRFLPRLTRAVKVGICHAWRIFPVIPAEEHDIAMDYVIAVNEL